MEEEDLTFEVWDGFVIAFTIVGIVSRYTWKYIDLSFRFLC